MLQNQLTIAQNQFFFGDIGAQNLRCVATRVAATRIASSYSCCIADCVAKPAICVWKPVSRSRGAGCAGCEHRSGCENLCASPVITGGLQRLYICYTHHTHDDTFSLSQKHLQVSPFPCPPKPQKRLHVTSFRIHFKLQKPSHLTPFPLFLDSTETVTCNLFSPTPTNSQTTETVIAFLYPSRASWMSYFENVIAWQMAQTVN